MIENNFISWLRRTIPPPDASVVCGSGPDDCALVKTACGGTLAMSTDAIVEGTHFLAEADPRDVGWKAMAVSLSDLAASGCRPRWALAAVSLRRGCGDRYAQELLGGLLDAAARYGVSLVGGDTVSAEAPTMLTTTVVGEPFPGGPITRKGAMPGDVLAVTGALGGSGLGRHLRPIPRVEEMGRLLAFSLELASEETASAARRDVPSSSEHSVHAAMDISDGLAVDLPRLCAESGVGAVIYNGAVPLSEDCRRAADASGRDAVSHALGDGEDFELLLAIDRRAWPRVEKWWSDSIKRAGGPGLTAVGEFTRDAGIYLEGGGKRSPLTASGYVHTW